MRAPRLPNLDLLTPGDWLFRRTDSLAGYLSRQADPQTAFSHVGIVIRDGAAWKVVLATPADEDGAGGVRADPVSCFTEHTSVTAIALARCSATTLGQRQKMATVAQSFIGRPFDGLFDSSDEHALYCSELVWRAATAAGILLDRPLRTLTSPLGNHRVVSLTTLAEQPGLSWLLRDSRPR